MVVLEQYFYSSGSPAPLLTHASRRQDHVPVASATALPHHPRRFGQASPYSNSYTSRAMPATLPPTTTSPYSDSATDYGPPLAGPIGTQETKLCCQCHSPLSSDAQMTFHVALDHLGGGELQQAQICARCVITSGLLGINEEEDESTGGIESLAPDEALSYVPGARIDDLAGGSMEVEDRLLSPSPHALLKSLTLPLSPQLQIRSTSADTPDLDSDPEVFASPIEDLHGSDRITSLRGTPSPRHTPQPSSSVPVWFAPSSSSTHDTQTGYESAPPRSPSPNHLLTPISPEVFDRPRSFNTGPPTLPDTYTDITHIRRVSESRGCLYPGSVFSGTQKSGRNSYDVTVTIIDVSFTEGTLTGYLLIHNLTSSHPQLTTLFTADLIGGSDNGFYTDAWGASQEDDMTHWSRFRGFSAVKKEMRGPKGLIPSRERQCVFMRWKERFLVPDHRIRDINGASFAGFYYVCVDFDPSSSRESPSPSPHPPSVSSTSANRTISGPRLPPTPSRRARSASLIDVRALEWDRERSERLRRLEQEAGSGYGTATMEGLYFHQNSEPYQHLSLRHMPERTSSSFEFR